MPYVNMEKEQNCTKNKVSKTFYRLSRKWHKNRIANNLSDVTPLESWSHLKLHRSTRKYIFPTYTLHFNTIKYTKVTIKVYDASVKWNNSYKSDCWSSNRVISLLSYRRIFWYFVSIQCILNTKTGY